MAKPNFSEMMGKMKTDASGLAEKIKAGTIEAAEKVKSGTVEVAGKVKTGTVEIAGKVKTGTAETADKVKETADTLIKKISKKDTADDSEFNAEEAIDQSQAEDQTAEESPKIKLDDLLRMAVDEYNDAYTTMNDNGATLYRERTRAVDMILHVEDLVNSIANRPKDFDGYCLVALGYLGLITALPWFFAVGILFTAGTVYIVISDKTADNK